MATAWTTVKFIVLLLETNYLSLSAVVHASLHSVYCVFVAVVLELVHYRSGTFVILNWQPH